MIPIRDENPTLRRPIATYILIATNLIVWAVVQGFGLTEPMAYSLCNYALIPGDLLGTIQAGTQIALGDGWVCQLDGDGELSSLISSMFLHGSWLHIGGNMLFLWVWRQCRRCDGARQIFSLLPTLRSSRSRRPDSPGYLQRGAHGGCVGRHRRHHGCVRNPLPARAGTPADHFDLLCYDRICTRCPDAWLLVPVAVTLGRWNIGPRGRGRCLLGARRRFRSRCCPDHAI